MLQHQCSNTGLHGLVDCDCTPGWCVVCDSESRNKYHISHYLR